MKRKRTRNGKRGMAMVEMIFVLPIVLRYLPPKFGMPIQAATVEHIQFMTIGALIVLFLIVEPAGLARLWQIAKQKLRVWPFPY